MDLKHHDHLDEETGGQRAGEIRAERWESVLIRVFGGLVVISLVVLFWPAAEKCVVQLLGLEDSEMPKYEALKFLGIGMGGVLLALQAVIANKRAHAMEKTATAQAAAATAQAQATEEQATANKNTEQGQRQERLKNAIEHLGHEKVSVRLGGAYELFHLARDGEEKELRQTVLAILCAHIRQTTCEDKYQKEHPSKPSEEVQSLLTLLFVQEHKVFTGLDINLEGSWLNGSNLAQARLEKADLWEAELHGASLLGARLHGAHLEGAQLHGAWLSGARLHGAYLVNTQLHGAHLLETQLCGAELWNTQLHEARLWSTDLRGVTSFQGYPYDSFEVSINKRIGWESDLGSVIFAGGLTPEDVASIGTGLLDEDAKSLREKLKAHIKEEASHELPDNSGPLGPRSDPTIGAYTKEEADQWIAEYKTVVCPLGPRDSV